jgi:hypothetical protein
MLLGGPIDRPVVKATRERIVHTLGLMTDAVCARVIVIAFDLATTAFPTRESWSSTSTRLLRGLRLISHWGKWQIQEKGCMGGIPSSSTFPPT